MRVHGDADRVFLLLMTLEPTFDILQVDDTGAIYVAGSFDSNGLSYNMSNLTFKTSSVPTSGTYGMSV